MIEFFRIKRYCMQKNKYFLLIMSIGLSLSAADSVLFEMYVFKSSAVIDTLSGELIEFDDFCQEEGVLAIEEESPKKLLDFLVKAIQEPLGGKHHFFKHSAIIKAINTRLDLSYFLFSYAICSQRIDMAEALIVLGVDINGRSFQGLTPLHFAVQSGEINFVRCFIKHGASTTATNKYGLSALALAEERYCLRPVFPEICKVLAPVS